MGDETVRNEPGSAVLTLFADLVDRIKSCRPKRTDGKPLGGGIVYSQMVLGMPIDPRDYKDPWSPNTGSASADPKRTGWVPATPASPVKEGEHRELDPKQVRAMQAALRTSQLCNLLLQVTSDDKYLEYPTGKHLDFCYQSIITGMQPLAMPEIAPEDQKRIDEARKVLYMLDEEGTKLGDTRLFASYQRNSEDYENAKRDYTLAMAAARTDPVKADLWPLLSGSYQRKVDNAWDRFRTAGAEKIERALAVVESVGISMQAAMIVKARKLFDVWNLGLAGVAEPIPYSSILPTAWCDPEATDIGFEKLEVTVSDYNSQSSNHLTRDSQGNWSSNSSATNAAGGISVGFAGVTANRQSESSDRSHSSAGGWAFDNSFTNSASGLTISLEYALCTIHRPWLVSDLFYTRNWYLVGEKKNSISDGTIQGQLESAKPLLPMIPQQILVIRNVRISAENWGQDGESLAAMYGSESVSASSSSSKVSGSGGACLGWINFGARFDQQEAHEAGSQFSHAKRQAAGRFSTHFDGTTLEIRGAQIIAFLSDIVPACPPLDDPNVKP